MIPKIGYRGNPQLSPRATCLLEPWVQPMDLPKGSLAVILDTKERGEVKLLNWRSSLLYSTQISKSWPTSLNWSCLLWGIWIPLRLSKAKFPTWLPLVGHPILLKFQIRSLKALNVSAGSVPAQN